MIFNNVEVDIRPLISSTVRARLLLFFCPLHCVICVLPWYSYEWHTVMLRKMSIKLRFAQGKWCLFYTRKKCEINCFGGHKHGFFSYTCAASNRVASQLVWIELRWTKSCASSRKSLPWSYCLFRLMSHNSFFSLFSSSFHLIAPNNVKSINNLSRIRRFKAA